MQLDPSTLVWKTVKASGDKLAEAKFVCPKCQKHSSLHPNYIKLGISGCFGKGKCNKTEDIIAQMVYVRGWQLEKIEMGSQKGNTVVSYRKPNTGDHVCVVKFQTLSRGGQCKDCVDNSKICKVKIDKIERPKCGCTGAGKQIGRGRGYGKLCPHYNFAVCYPDASQYWDYELNYPVKPDNISPHTHDVYWFRCDKEWCLMPYERTVAEQGMRGDRCPFCSGKRACQWNCLETTHPELALEFDIDNEFGPRDVTYGSHKDINWICRKVPEQEHRWKVSVYSRTISKTGCPYCNCGNYLIQKHGHEQFVVESNTIHNNKYLYPDEYCGSMVPINIHCPVLGHDGNPHGLFRKCPSSHKAGEGCPICTKSTGQSKAISQLEEILKSLGLTRNVDWFPEKTFDNLVHIYKLRIDVYIPRFKLCIECDGQQHFESISAWGGDVSYWTNRYRDKLKDIFIIGNGMNLLRIPYTTKDQNKVREILMWMFHVCTIQQQYVSYEDYQNQTRQVLNLANVFLTTIPEPKAARR